MTRGSTIQTRRPARALRARTAVKGRDQPMAAFNAGFVEQRRTIEIKADIQQGWDPQPNTYAFRREFHLTYKNGIVLRISVDVYPQPGGLEPRQQLFPATLSSSSSSGTIPAFELADCNLTFRIPLIRE